MSFGTNRHSACPFIALVLVWCAGAETPASEDLPPALTAVQHRIQTVLDKLDISMRNAADRLSDISLDSDAARHVLAELVSKHAFAVDACTVNPWGRIIAAEPEAYRHIEGRNIRRQEQVRRLYQTQEPVMSQVIDTVEGFRAVDIEYPIFNADEMLIGSVSLLIRHGIFLDQIIRPTVQGLPVDIWVMQTNGLVLYSADPDKVGSNALQDDLYHAQGPLLGVAGQVAVEPSGATTYTLQNPTDEERTEKSLHWTTVSLYGTAWRISMVQVIEGSPEAAKGEFDDLQLMYARDALRRLCSQSLVKRFMQGDNTVGMRMMLDTFYASFPYLYSVQWLDVDGVTRFGSPQEHSLRNFDHKELRNPGDQEFLDALKAGDEHWMVTELREGNTGLIYMCPVHTKGTIHGMIYFISLLAPEDESGKSEKAGAK